MSFVLPGVVRIPERNSFLEGAMLEPVNTVLKAVKRLALMPGDNVLVVGQGPIGLLFTRLLALSGANVAASDFLDTRLKIARQMGAKWIIKAQDSGKPGTPRPSRSRPSRPIHHPSSIIHQLTSGFDAAVVCAPSDAAVLQAQQAVHGGGKVLLFAHTRRGVTTPLDLSTICVDEKDLIGSYSSDFSLQGEVARLVFSRRLDVRQLITHCMPLEEAAAAIELAAHPTPESLKIMVVQEDITPGSAGVPLASSLKSAARA
jgi:L-iditol 2-dehydrogenase